MASDLPNPNDYPNPDYRWELNNWWAAQRRQAAAAQQESTGTVNRLAWPFRGHGQYANEPVERYEPHQWGSRGYYGEEARPDTRRRLPADFNPYLPAPLPRQWEAESGNEYGLEYLLRPQEREAFGERPHYIEQAGQRSRQAWRGQWQRSAGARQTGSAAGHQNLPAYPPEHYLQRTTAGAEYGLEYIMRPEGREDFGRRPHPVSWTEQSGQWLPSAPGHAGKGPKNYQRSDEHIADEINKNMSDDDLLDASDIDVRVEKGAVTLTGSVPVRPMKQIAADIAEGTAGVDFVKNHLKVRNK